MKLITILEWMLWILASFLIFLIAIFSGVEMVIGATIDPGACYETNYTEYLNATNSTASRTLSVCANNCSCIMPYSVIDLSINPGQSYYRNGTYYNVSAYCSTNLTNSNKCVIDDKADPGERYEYNSAVCEIDIDIEDCDDVEECREGLPTSYNQKWQIRYSNISRRIQFDFADQQKIWSIEDNVDISGSIGYQCPTTIVNETTAAVTTELCHALGEVYCGDAFDLMVQLKEGAEVRRGEYESKLENCRLEIVGLQENSVCVPNDEYARLKAENIVVNNESQTCATAKGYKEYELAAEKDTRLGWFIVALFLFALNLWQFWNPKKGPRASKVGGMKGGE